MMRRALCLLFLVLASPAVSAADATTFVVDYDLKGGDIAIRSASGSAVAVGVGLPLYDGAVVTASGAATVTLDDGRGTWTVLTAAGSPFTVRGVGPGGVVWREIGRVMEIVRWQVREETVSARTRNDYALAVPLLEIDAPSLKLPAGPRTLVIGWLDGTFPVRWRIAANGGVHAEATSQAVRRIEIPVSLRPGPAELRVVDASGQERIFPLEVVSALPAAILAETTAATSPVGRMRAATALSRMDGSAFILEAVALLSTRNATRAETALRAAIEMGERP